VFGNHELEHMFTELRELDARVQAIDMAEAVVLDDVRKVTAEAKRLGEISETGRRGHADHRRRGLAPRPAAARAALNL